MMTSSFPERSSAPGFSVQPWDTYNQELVANVHPAAWINPIPTSRYNLVVVGAGTAGLVSAIGGAKVAIVDRAMLDGEPEGFPRIHVESGSGRLLGTTVVARHAGEMIGERSFSP